MSSSSLNRTNLFEGIWHNHIVCCMKYWRCFTRGIRVHVYRFVWRIAVVYTPLPNNPRSPPFLAELQSLNWEARVSKFSSPDLISSMYSAHKQQRSKDQTEFTDQTTSPCVPPPSSASLTLNEVQRLIFSSCDILFPPGRRTTWLIVLHQQVRAPYLSERKKTDTVKTSQHQEIRDGSTKYFLIWWFYNKHGFINS